MRAWDKKFNLEIYLGELIWSITLIPFTVHVHYIRLSQCLAYATFIEYAHHHALLLSFKGNSSQFLRIAIYSAQPPQSSLVPSTTSKRNSIKKSPMTRSEQMQRVKNKDSKAEKQLRSILHKNGLRYRIHQRIEGVTVDIVFPGARVAVMVDGCFWHGCPIHATYPKTNESYWLPKLAENKERDARQTKKLFDAGWTVIRAWEHECLPPSPSLVSQIIRSVQTPSARTS